MEKEERCCGNCCWFCHEDTDGWGQCMTGNTMEGWEADLDPIFGYIAKCDHPAGDCSEFVSRQEMRHHMAVLLLYKRWIYDRRLHRPLVHRKPEYNEIERAVKFSYKYMKVFSEL